MNTVSRTISDETLSRIIHIESAGKPTAKARTSSASGLGQFINATWLGTVAKHKPSWAVGKTNQQLLELRADSICSRFNAMASIEMLARFTEDNAKALGAGYTDGDLYLAHFSGVGTARKLLKAGSQSLASSIFSAAAIKANRSILDGKTCGDVRAWANRKMAAAGGRNWIAVHWKGAKPVTPAKDKAAAGAATAGGAGTVAAGVQAGWGAMEWLIAIGCAALVIGGGIAIWQWRKRRSTPVKIEADFTSPPPPVAKEA